jgi:UDP-2,4-diacetamido-2,4,6-trideoxy-beta-L-altropyranose hydrolase
MRSRLFFRVDGDMKIGLGHIVRCLSLAKMLRQNFEVTFCTQIIEPGMFQAVLKNFKCELVKTEEQFLEKLLPHDFVVLDGYHFPASIQVEIKRRQCILICIDDLHDKHFCCDILINHAPEVTKEMYSVEPYTKLLLGPEFALLRPSFIEEASKVRRVDSTKTVLINFGGADPKNLTLSTLKTVLEYREFLEVKVVTGSSYQNLLSLAEIVDRHPLAIKHYRSLDEIQMRTAIVESELAIVPSSGVLFETIACKTPCISGYYVSNQQDIYNGFLRRGAFYDCKDFTEGNLKAAIEVALSADPNEQIQVQSNCIDGRSPVRIQQVFNSYLAA